MELESLILDLSILIEGGGKGMSESGTGTNLVRVEIIAKLFGLTVRRIQQLTQEGIIEIYKNESGKSSRQYDLIPTTQKYITYLQNKVRSKSGRSDAEIELKEQKLRADIALKESQGELHRIKTSIAQGDYISVEEIKLDYAKFFVIFKKFAMSLPSRLGGMLSGSLEPLELRRIEKELSTEIIELLDSFVVAAVAKPKAVKEILNGEKKGTPMAEEV